MIVHPHMKYHPFPPVQLSNRRWPSQIIDAAPVWCSVDLRDGNQALVEPMDLSRKQRMFDLLVHCGFKEIEIGFPSASQIDYDFVRYLIENDLIPDDVTVQVLTPARREFIDRTFEALEGIRRAIVHLYNSTSTVQRELVFRRGRDGIIALAVEGAKCVLSCTELYQGSEWVLQYSPESFTGTELDFAAEICNAVNGIWKPSHGNKVIINLPATIEMSTPNVYADQIEWMGSNLDYREGVILSIHPHNDRGTAIAAAELALMAGAERVEGTLFGNGERTGNVDLITLALNLYTQGIEPHLDLSNLGEVVHAAEYCNQIPVHPRHPYAGELVFTAFSGSHQDAIRKGFAAQQEKVGWQVPYLPIDPADLGRTYEAIIRINSQSGKGGIAYILEKDYGLHLPPLLQVEFRQVVQEVADARGQELTPDDIWMIFEKEYLQTTGPYKLSEYGEQQNDRHVCGLTASITVNGAAKTLNCTGRGPIDAFVKALADDTGFNLKILDFHEHAVGSGSDATAIAYAHVAAGNGPALFGVGRDTSIVAASLQSVVSATNRLVNLQER